MIEQTPRSPDLQSSWKMSCLIWGVMPSQAISAAAQLGIADLVGAQPRTAQQLARATSTEPAALRRLLRALAGLGIFSEDAAGKFVNTPLSDTLRSDHPESVRPLAMMWGRPLFLAPWGQLPTAIATGEAAFDQLYGEPFFDHLARDAEDAAVFDAAMACASKADLPAILAAYDFSGFDCIADIGGGRGALLVGLVEAHVGLRGILYDLPGVIAGATALRDRDIGERCQVIGGSFFDEVPAGADAFVLKRVIHDWDDEQARKILGNCRKVLRPGGKVLLVERVLRPPNEPDFGRFMDLHMLVMLRGRERTESEFRILLGEAGLSLTRVIPTSGPHSIIEAEPD